MNELITTENKKIENLIYEIRGQQVMLDSDLALLYNCKNGTKDINKAVKRNIERFPIDFYFQLTKEECNYIPKFQTGTLEKGKNLKYLPHAFTEQGIAMLASVLHTDIAVSISVKIMRTFILMRKYILNNLIEQKYINNMVLEHDNDIKLLKETFDNFKTKANHIFFENQIYDAYSLLLDIFESSKESIIIIDNYADKKLLDLLSKTKKKIKVYSKNMNEVLIKKYQNQYSNVEIIKNDLFHDRFIIIDNKFLYHCGASFKELGNKCFAINKIEEQEWLNRILICLK